MEHIASIDADGIEVSLVRGPGELRFSGERAMAFVTFAPQVVRLRVAAGGSPDVTRPARMRSGGLCFAPPGAQREVTLDAGAELVQVAVEPRTLAALLRRAGAGRMSRLAAFEGRRDPAVAQIGPELRRTLIAGEAGQGPSAAGTAGGRAYLRCIAEALLLRCLHPALQAAVSEPDRLSARALLQVDRLIAGAVERGSSVREMALAAGLSPSHFSRAYKATTGESPHQALLRRRVERGCELLRTTALGIADIAARTGFASQAHFTSTFRRIVGMTPGMFRRHAMGAPVSRVAPERPRGTGG